MSVLFGIVLIAMFTAKSGLEVNSSSSIIDFSILINLYDGIKPVHISGFMHYLAIKHLLDEVNQSNETSKLFLFNQTAIIKKVILLQPPTQSKDIVNGIWPDKESLFIPANVLLSAISSDVIEKTQLFFYAHKKPIINLNPRTYGFKPNVPMIKESRLLSSGYDYHRLHVVLDLLNFLHFHYLSVLSSTEVQTLHISKVFKRSFKGCINALFIIGSNYLENFEKISQHLSYLNSTNVGLLVLFTSDKDSQMVLESLKILKLGKRFTLLFVFGGTHIDVIRGLEEIAHGALTIDHFNEENLHFKNYVLQQNPYNNLNDEHFLMYYEDVYQCNLKIYIPSPKRQSFRNQCIEPYLNLSSNHGYYYSPISKIAINALKDFFETLHEVMVGNGCVVNSTDCPNFFDFNKSLSENKNYDILLKALKIKYQYDLNSLNTTYAIYNFQIYNTTTFNKIIGLWEHQKLKIYDAFQFGYQTPNKVCSLPCPPGYFKKFKGFLNHPRCCWDCIECPLKHIVVNETCLKCAPNKRANLTTNQCDTIPFKYFSFEKSSWKEISISILSFTGMVFVICEFVVSIKFRGHDVVKSAGFEFSLTILCGNLLLFICPFVYFATPNALVCASRNIVPSLACVIIYSALLLKVIRVFRIFTSSKMPTPLKFIRRDSQLMAVAFCSALQLIYTCLWFFESPPVSEHIVSADETHINIVCRNSQTISTILKNNICLYIIQMLCNAVAFSCRGFPQKYHESFYINIISHASIVLWAIFYTGLGFLIINVEYLICYLCIFLGYITFLGLSINKIKCVIQYFK
ncbi:metabotropic glutamate receptor 3 isoform X2 [Hydra vulgaris]|uniref:metabotropic glutamate receptor 3 isoform X2 n=1 Tax=Hydra vulgaris TaxID=6087 RepID=UPI001F5F263A|nr:metabotropic glutamate receptor 3-like [Hydra vulgaris]